MGARHLYRLTNDRIGGRSIAGSPILLLAPGGGSASSGPDRSAYVRDGDRYVLCASNAAPLGILAGTTTCAGPAGPRSRSDLSRLPSAPRLPIPAGCSPLCADVQGLRRLRAQDQPPDPAPSADPRAPAEHDLTGCRLEHEPQPPHQRGPQPPKARLMSQHIWPRQSPMRRRRRPRRWKRRKAWLLSSCRKWLWPAGHMSPVVRCRPVPTVGPRTADGPVGPERQSPTR
jgi:hypothetical protein